MKIVITENYEEMSQEAARVFLHHYYQEGKPNNLAITGGKTPERMYEILVPILQRLPNPDTEFFLFDEIPVKGKQGVTSSTMDCLLFNHIDHPVVHTLNKENYQDYDRYIAEKGGIRFIMMGLGMDGHFCGNLSGTLDSFDEGVRAVRTDLNDCIRDRLAFLSGGEEFREDQYYTYGPKTVMDIPEACFIVSGKNKAEILKKVIEGPITTEVPSSVFQKHPNCTFIIDKEAASSLK